MNTYALSHLADAALSRGMDGAFVQGHAADAAQIAHIAEFDARRLFRPAGYPSMFAYCMDRYRLSEQSTLKRLRAARAAREFPAIFTAVAENRLNLSAVVMLTPHLKPDTADALIEAAMDKTLAELEVLLAHRNPKPDVPTALTPAPAVTPAPPELSLRTVGDQELAGVTVAEMPALSARTVVRPDPPAKLKPLAPEKYELHMTIPQSTHDKLRLAQELLGHEVASKDIPGVFDLALDALIGRLGKRKFAATSKPRKPVRKMGDTSRHIPAHVQRAVWKRDHGQCTFVSDTGKRCCSRRDLEFDHIEPFARGGNATAGNIRLRCRAHNQYEAERTYGEGFMNTKRDEARSRQKAAAEPNYVEKAREELIPWLKALGYRTDEAQRAAARADDIAEAPLEQRMKRALFGVSAIRFHSLDSLAKRFRL